MGLNILSWYFNNCQPCPAMVKEMSELKTRLFFGLVPFHRMTVLASAFFVQFCFGTMYTWAVFVSFINKAMQEGGKSSDFSLVFMVLVSTFGLVSPFVGPLIKRFGPRRICQIGASMFFLGHLLTALGLYTKQGWLLFLGNGVIGGAGCSIGNPCSIIAAQKYFPDKRGLASSITIAGYGGGAVIAPLLAILAKSIPEIHYTFLLLGGIYFVVQMIGSLALSFPPANYMAISKPAADDQDDEAYEESSQTQRQKVHEREKIVNATTAFLEKRFPNLRSSLLSNIFAIWCIVFAVNSTAGVYLIGKIETYSKVIFKDSQVTGVIVAVTSVFNVCGRLSFGVLSNRFGGGLMYLVSSIVQILAVLQVHLAHEYQVGILFHSGMYFVGFCFGSGFSMAPVTIIQIFGVQSLDFVFPISFAVWAGLCITCILWSFVAKNFESETGGAFPFLWVMAGIHAIAAIMMKIYLSRRQRSIMAALKPSA